MHRCRSWLGSLALPLFVLAFLLALSRSASADESLELPPPPAESPPPQTRWYGWQTLAGDSLALGSLAFVRKEPAVTSIGASIYFGSSLVHVGHGHPYKGLASLGLRLLLPAFGALFGGAATAGSTCPEGALTCDVPGNGAAIGGVVGALVAIAVDAAFLAREDVVRPPPVMARF